MVALAAEVEALRRLPYSTSWIEEVSETELGLAPTPDFEIGGLKWPVVEYAVASALEPFRKVFTEHCGGTEGIDAALCASRHLAGQSPIGAPRHEFVDANYDPIAVLEEHLQGAPGHCTTRSALVAAELLSVGIPARLVQLIPAAGGGHNIFSVWDVKEGWTLIDPTVPGVVTKTGHATSTRELLRYPTAVSVSSSGAPTTSAAGPSPALSTAETALYPEPWLYLRVGPRAAQWPFRGTFARIRRDRLTLGPLQKILFFASATTLMALVVIAGLLIRAVVSGLRLARSQAGVA